MSDSATATKPSRRHQILESLARELEANPGERITTAHLAKSVGISEAALYRHFTGKADMFEALIEFSEQTIFGLINRILEKEQLVQERCSKIMSVLLGFSARNPGITRILLGDALVGEIDPNLRRRVEQFYDRLMTQFKQILREGMVQQQMANDANIQASANLLVVIAQGKMAEFVRSGFKILPTDHWPIQWQLLSDTLFAPR